MFWVFSKFFVDFLSETGFDEYIFCCKLRLKSPPEKNLEHVFPHLPELNSCGFVDVFCSHVDLGGGNSNIFGIFTPKIGEMIQFDDHIFQMG